MNTTLNQDLNQDLEQFVMECKKGATFASIVIKKLVGMRKGTKNNQNPLYAAGKVVESVSKQLILTNVSYGGMVNKRRTNEGLTADFVSAGLWGGKGQYYHNSPFGALARHIEKGTKYFTYSQLKSLSFQYLVDGQPATEEEILTIKEWKSKSTPPKNQGVENPVIWRTVGFDQVETLVLDKRTYQKNQN
jgi:hypothetical protein